MGLKDVLFGRSKYVTVNRIDRFYAEGDAYNLLGLLDGCEPDKAAIVLDRLSELVLSGKGNLVMNIGTPMKVRPLLEHPDRGVRRGAALVYCALISSGWGRDVLDAIVVSSLMGIFEDADQKLATYLCRAVEEMVYLGYSDQLYREGIARKLSLQLYYDDVPLLSNALFSLDLLARSGYANMMDKELLYDLLKDLRMHDDEGVRSYAEALNTDLRGWTGEAFTASDPAFTQAQQAGGPSPGDNTARAGGAPKPSTQNEGYYRPGHSTVKRPGASRSPRLSSDGRRLDTEGDDDRTVDLGSTRSTEVTDTPAQDDGDEFEIDLDEVQEEPERPREKKRTIVIID